MLKVQIDQRITILTSVLSFSQVKLLCILGDPGAACQVEGILVGESLQQQNPDGCCEEKVVTCSVDHACSLIPLGKTSLIFCLFVYNTNIISPIQTSSEDTY